MLSSKIVVFTVIFCCVLNYAIAQDSAMDDFFKKASKNIPRIGRSNSKSSKGSNDDFENFFLKASKSVPRIGRRDRTELEGPVAEFYNRDNVDTDKSYSRMGRPLSELSKYNQFLGMEDFVNAYNDALEVSSLKEKERSKRNVY